HSGSSCFGIGRQMRKKAIHQKTMLRMKTKISSRKKATMKMIWIEKEQMKAIPSPSDGSLNSGGSFSNLGSWPLRFFIFCRTASDIMKLTPFLNLRSPAMLTSLGSGMRTGRTGASGSKKGAKRKDAEGWLTARTGGSHCGRS